MSLYKLDITYVDSAPNGTIVMGLHIERELGVIPAAGEVVWLTDLNKSVIVNSIRDIDQFHIVMEVSPYRSTVLEI